MRNTPFDILVLCKDSDRNKLKYLYDSIGKNIHGYSNIYVVHQEGYSGSLDNYTFTDYQVIDSQFKDGIKHRPSWIFQQYIKLFQNVTEHPFYLVIDADVYINKPLTLFSRHGKANFFIGSVPQRHPPYFEFLRACGIEKAHDQTFICEVMMFNKLLLRSYLQSVSHTPESWMEAANRIITPDCYLSEFEFYGNLMMQLYPGLYGIEYIQTVQIAKESDYTDQEIEKIINNQQLKHMDIISYHTWTK